MHVFHHIKELNKDAVCIYIDIFHTKGNSINSSQMGG